MSSARKIRLTRLEAFAPLAARQLIDFAAGVDAAAPVLGEADTRVCTAVKEWLEMQREADQAEFLLLLGTPTMAEFMAIGRKVTQQDRVLIVERDLSKALHFVQVNLFENMLQQKRLAFALGDQKEQVKLQFFGLYDARICPNIRILDTERSSPEAARFYYGCLREIREDMRLDTFNAGTLICKGPLWQLNTLKNLPGIIRHPGINALTNLLVGKPALVIGAGPSLNEALPYISELASRFFVISTGTALRPLRAAGIRPDLVVAVDGSHLIAPQFEADCEDLFLACSSLVFADITDRFKGLFTGALDASPLDRWIESIREPRGTLYAGGTVTCSAMYLACLAGCTTVCTIGLDLCFQEDGTTHANGTMYHGKRYETGACVRVPGNFRPTVPTTQQFQCYIDLIADFVAKMRKTHFVNINSGGALIRGMALASAADLDRYAADPAFDAAAAVEQAHARFQPRDPDSVLAELKSIREELDSLIEKSRSAAGLCNRVMVELKTPGPGTLETIRPVMNDIMAIEEELENAKQSSSFIQMSLWPAMYEFSIKRHDDETEAATGDRTEALRRFRQLYEQIGGASKWTRDALNQVFGNWDRIFRAGGRPTRTQAPRMGENRPGALCAAPAEQTA